MAEFIVIEGKGISLMVRETAIRLNVLKIGVNIAIDIASSVKQQFPKVFNGVGKLNTKQVSLHIDPEVTPVAQPLSRTPFNLRGKVEEKVEELVRFDIIEPLDGPTP
ncbi:uncharacterized protein LOC121373122 [Gigantopelta aegis]|uniref:uncharacterized protein LOC121373122 n=1 Tax=Gigantopelta aegis TaxID=1735272 RepID=UPI001B88BFCC|nr:uncharacterized protein LOC121373122 [Gigantopelta aegis]